MELSIILPVYNVEDYLETCIESLCNQKSNEVEFIFIDDGSTDNSLNIIKNAASTDQRIQVFSKINEGSGYARNYGLTKCSGKYVYFMDPDDWIEDSFVETVLKQIETVDLIIFGYNEYRNGQLKRSVGSNRYFLVDEKELTGSSFEKIFEIATLFQVWNKIYRREFLVKNNFVFTNQKTGQDALFNIELIKSVQKTIVLTEVLYNYNAKRIGSAQTRYNKNKMSDNLNIAEKYTNLCSYFKIGGIKPKEYLVEIFFEDIKSKVIHGVKPYWFSEKYKAYIYGIKIKDIQNHNTKIKLLLLKYSMKSIFKFF